MKNIILGDFIIIDKNKVCPMFPLKDFVGYRNQKRNNQIQNGTVISICSSREHFWFLVENNHKVIVISNF